MKKSLLLIASLILTLSAFSQAAYLQYRHVPAEHDDKFIERETKHWSKVAKAAIDQGHMTGWSLWRKVGTNVSDGPNYVFVNNFESFDKMDPSKIWSDENLAKLGAKPDDVETNSFTTVSFDYYMQLEDAIMGDYTYAVVNYAKPTSRTTFIEENKSLWKPVHEKNIKDGTNGMTSWGLMSVVAPAGNLERFSCLTWDGFNSMADALNYLSYSSPNPDGDGMYSEIMDKSKMNEIMPNGFEYSLIYERVMSVAPDEN
ncbi:MAG: hypothetical protein KJO49_10420 [Bacteroidia bacterium]|nr:hypothetical protein [Bacteroidia bacterium]MBT8268750.1 hypothetical protein [Bacteroidia bacterium]NNF81549.1 hypothetical protein [Flavobacteriaceae bacterium]NNK71537.1 hypothetical protein [Flavobacteriaceae bacterium]